MLACSTAGLRPGPALSTVNMAINRFKFTAPAREHVLQKKAKKHGFTVDEINKVYFFGSYMSLSDLHFCIYSYNKIKGFIVLFVTLDKMYTYFYNRFFRAN